jgi:PEP-CTERM motif
MRRVQLMLSMSFALALLGSVTPNAKADTYQTYNLAWSGALEGADGENATGVMTLDLTTLINPTTIANSLGNSGAFDIVGDITSLSVTVTGAPGGGNGTWTKADLCACSTLFGAFTDAFTIWDTNGQTVNMDGDVLAQLMADGGDFNLWFKGDGPQGVGRLILDPDGGGVVGMLMTEFAPVVTPPVVTPEPSTISLMLTGVALLGVMAARKRLSLGH